MMGDVQWPLPKHAKEASSPEHDSAKIAYNAQALKAVRHPHLYLKIYPNPSFRQNTLLPLKQPLSFTSLLPRCKKNKNCSS